MTETAHRCGAVALLGRPNAGKSTLLNRLLGEKLAIVSRKPQTTRSRILGILTLEDAQLLFYDTPGFHESAKALNRALNEAVIEAARGCDAALLLVDPAGGWDDAHETLLAELHKRGRPALLVATKADLAPRLSGPGPPQGAASTRGALQVSARTGEGIPELLRAIVAELPEGPPHFPEDALTDRSLRFLVAERIREAVFEALEQELPYETAVEIVEFDESRRDLVRIRAHLLVERDSQKRIVVGREGSVIRAIGIAARREIEALLGKHVYLDLWVKPEAKWSQRPKRLKSLGYW